MKRVLFICGKARQRSPTADEIFRNEPNIETDFAGLSDDADVVLSVDQIEWATDIAVMEKRQIARLKTKYAKHLKGKRFVSLDVADDYAFMQPELIALLQSRRGRIL
jgi:predicted protein tyrosine phosphatase